MSRPGRTFGVALVVVIVVLVVTLCIFVIRALQTVEELTARRSIATDALAVSAEQNECVDRTQSEWMLQLTLALQYPTNSPERDQAFLKMATVADELRTINERCYKDNPVPTSTQDEGGAAAAPARDGEDGRDGIDGRNGRDGRDGEDSTVPGPAGPPGSDAPPAKDGTDGTDSMVPGPQGPPGPPGETVVGPAGESIVGPQGPPGFDGQPPIGWEVLDENGDVVSVCNDPDGDLVYTCKPPAPEG